MEDQIAEYETQLAEVETLLQASPEDSSLLSLKSDLLELISITKQSTSAPPREKEQAKPLAGNLFDEALQAAVGTGVDVEESQTGGKPTAAATAELSSHSFADTVQEAAAAAASIPTSIDTTAKEVPKKKTRKPKAEFEVPKHLIPLDTDTASERNKKRRAVKALKSKWRQSKKEAETAQKQKSWQSFQKKKKLKTSSMFSSSGDAAVGVVVAANRRQKDEKKDD